MACIIASLVDMTLPQQLKQGCKMDRVGITIIGCSEAEYKDMVRKALHEAYNVDLTDTELNKLIENQLSLNVYTASGSKYLKYAFKESDDHNPFVVDGVSHTSFMNKTRQALIEAEIEISDCYDEDDFLAKLGQENSESSRKIRCFSNIETDADEKDLYEVMDSLSFISTGDHMSGDVIEFEFFIFNDETGCSLDASLAFFMEEEPKAYINISLSEETGDEDNVTIVDSEIKNVAKDVRESTVLDEENNSLKEGALDKIEQILNGIRKNKNLSRHFL